MSVVVKRSVTIEGHKTSVTLEDEFWDALRVIAQRDKTTMVSLVHQINQARNQSNLSSAIRVFVLKRSTIIMMDQEKEKPVHSIGAAA
jgi:predicted DNA-binding ribbon-helix-helix protein